MRTAIGMIAIALSVSGCSAVGSPLFGTSQRYGYATPRADPTQPAALAGSPLSASPAAQPSPTRVVAVRAPADMPVYDESKDPYVTAVLTPPVDTTSFEDEIGPDGKRIVLAPIAKLDIIDVRGNAGMLAAANP